jgi:hypothetical protein
MKNAMPGVTNRLQNGYPVQKKKEKSEKAMG